MISCVTWLREICPRSKGSARHWCTYDSTLTTGTYVTWEPAAHTFMWPCLRVRVRVFLYLGFIMTKKNNKTEVYGSSNSIVVVAANRLYIRHPHLLSDTLLSPRENGFSGRRFSIGGIRRREQFNRTIHTVKGLGDFCGMSNTLPVSGYFCSAASTPFLLRPDRNA